jgi:chromosome segregation ATPase
LPKPKISQEKIESADIYVEAILDNTANLFPAKNNSQHEVKIRKTSTPAETLNYEVNGTRVKEDEYYRMLEVVGLKRKSSNNIILQGKIDQITQLSEKGLFDLLKNLIGSDKYDDKEEASRDIIGKTAPEEEKSKKLLDNFFEKLNDLTSDKEEYEQFLETEKLVQTLKHIVYRRNYDACFKKSIKDNEKAEAIRKDL